MGKQVWVETHPPKTEEDPYPKSTEGPWRFSAWLVMVALCQPAASVKSRDSEDEKQEAVKVMKDMTNKSLVRAGILRFRRLKEIPEDNDDEEAREIWILKYAPNAAGKNPEQCMEFCDANDLLGMISAECRADRAPKGGLQKAIERGLEKLYGAKERSGNGKGKGKGKAKDSDANMKD